MRTGVQGFCLYCEKCLKKINFVNLQFTKIGGGSGRRLRFAGGVPACHDGEMIYG